VNIYRGTSRADQIYYHYAKSMMGQKDYLMANHYFKSLLKEFPGSEFAEEAQFMVGYCSYLLLSQSRGSIRQLPGKPLNRCSCMSIFILTATGWMKPTG
jgi:hypothetical protein